MASYDRRMIAPLLVQFFPTMADAKDHKVTSDEWHGFLNAQTGLNVDIAEPNATAFDKWRQALANNQDLPVWKYTKAQLTAIRIKGEELKAAEDARVEALPSKLLQLASLAPTKTIPEMIRDAKRMFTA